ncbi:MAG: efflux RND transporter periplasmic adaptor subunit [Betaproteobacteria bacterium]|nr:efflux RND transporter periplasmic adaptor subunit [Betaproteobacteria bacterium]
MPPENTSPSAPRRGASLLAWGLAIAAVAVVVTGLATRSADAERLRERAQAQSVPTVTVIAPGKAGSAAALELPGRIEAFSRAPIFARVAGYVKSWHADIGASVKAGQLLAVIETPELDQQLQQARAELANVRASAELAAATARRWTDLLATGTVTRQGAEEKQGDYAAKRSQVAALQANVERYETLKRFSRVVAPFDGVVTARSTDVGALVNGGSTPGNELFVISDTKKLRVYVSVPQAHAAAIGQGAKATLKVPERPGRRYEATVQSLAQAINAASGSMLVQLAADNVGGELLPGGYVGVSFPLPAAAGTLTIPPSALLFDKAGLRVATVDAQGKVVLKAVTVARDTGALIEIATGLAAEDRVIDSPPDGIAAGDAVRVATAR